MNCLACSSRLDFRPSFAPPRRLRELTQTARPQPQAYRATLDESVVFAAVRDKDAIVIHGSSFRVYCHPHQRDLCPFNEQ